MCHSQYEEDRRSSFAHLISGHRVLLLGDGERDPGGLGAAALDDEVLHAGPGAHVVDAQLEAQLLVVGGALVAQERS